MSVIYESQVQMMSPLDEQGFYCDGCKETANQKVELKVTTQFGGLIVESYAYFCPTCVQPPQNQ